MPQPQPGNRVVVTWPNGRRYGTVSPSGSYLGRRDVCRGRATVRVIGVHSDLFCHMGIETNVTTSTDWMPNITTDTSKPPRRRSHTNAHSMTSA